MTHTLKNLSIFVTCAATATGVAVGCSGQKSDGRAGSADLTSSTSELVISQVYGGGANSDATYKYDFVELFNRGSKTINLGGKAIQYAGGGSLFLNRPTSTFKLPDDAKLEPGHYYLIQLSGDPNDKAPDLPTPDATGSLVLATAAGKVALVPADKLLDHCGKKDSPCPTTDILDLVGYGDATQAEGGPTAEPDSKNAAIRKDDGCTDTDDNKADFTIATAKARNSTVEKKQCAAAQPSTDAGPEDDATAKPQADDAGDASTPPAEPDAGPQPGPDAGPRPAGLVLLNEIKINPPGGSNVDDAPWEFVELLCSPGASLDGYYFAAIEGDADSSTAGAEGTADIVVNLAGKKCGANGLVLIAANGGHDAASSETTLIREAQLDAPNKSPLENATTSFVVILSPNAPIVKGTDYDPQNMGTLTLPNGANVVDGVATLSQTVDAAPDRVYAPVVKQKAGAAPGAAARILDNKAPMLADAWIAADIKGSEPKGLELDPAKASANFPTGAFALTPGAPNAAGSGHEGSSGNSSGKNPGDGNGDGDGDGDEGPATSSGGKKSSSGASGSVPAIKLGSPSADCAMPSSPVDGGGLAYLGTLAIAIGSLFSRRRRS